jgi:hypothetical protein
VPSLKILIKPVAIVSGVSADLIVRFSLMIAVRIGLG